MTEEFGTSRWKHVKWVTQSRCRLQGVQFFFEWGRRGLSLTGLHAPKRRPARNMLMCSQFTPSGLYFERNEPEVDMHSLSFFSEIRCSGSAMVVCLCIKDLLLLPHSLLLHHSSLGVTLQKLTIPTHVFCLLLLFQKPFDEDAMGFPSALSLLSGKDWKSHVIWDMSPKGRYQAYMSATLEIGEKQKQRVYVFMIFEYPDSTQHSEIPWDRQRNSGSWNVWKDGDVLRMTYPVACTLYHSFGAALLWEMGIKSTLLRLRILLPIPHFLPKKYKTPRKWHNVCAVFVRIKIIKRTSHHVCSALPSSLVMTTFNQSWSSQKWSTQF